ncbi:MAG: glycosyltransferase family 39 protein [Pseudomonadota bacterium]
MYARILNALSGNWSKTLSAIFLLALVVRIIFIFTLQGGYYFADEHIYTAAARQLLAQGEFPDDYGRAPLYPLLLAGIYAVIGDGITATRGVQALLGAGLAVLIASLGKRGGNAAVGAVAGILWSLYPMGVFIAGLIYPTTLLTLLLLAGVLSLINRPEARGYGARCALAGLLFGLGALAKPIVLGAIVCVAGWLLWRRGPGRFRLAAVFLLAALAALTPWTVRNAQVYHRLVPIEARTLTEVTPWADAGAAVEQSSPGRALWLKVADMARRFPVEFISFFELYPRRVNLLEQYNRDWAHEHRPNFVRYTSFGSKLVNAVSIVSVSTLYVFALVGMRVLWQARERRRELALLVIMVLSFALGYAAFWGKIRYRIPVDPYIIILSAWGMVHTLGLLAERARRKA